MGLQASVLPSLGAEPRPTWKVLEEARARAARTRLGSGHGASRALGAGPARRGDRVPCHPSTVLSEGGQRAHGETRALTFRRGRDPDRTGAPTPGKSPQGDRPPLRVARHRPRLRTGSLTGDPAELEREQSHSRCPAGLPQNAGTAWARGRARARPSSRIPLGGHLRTEQRQFDLERALTSSVSQEDPGMGVKSKNGGRGGGGQCPVSRTAQQPGQGGQPVPRPALSEPSVFRRDSSSPPPSPAKGLRPHPGSPESGCNELPLECGLCEAGFGEMGH